MTASQYSQTSGRSSFAAKIVSGSTPRRYELAMLANECAADITGDDVDPFADGLETISGRNECLLIDFLSISDRPQNELTNLSCYIETCSANALVWTDMESLDLAYAALPASMCHFLVNPTNAEAMLLLTGETKRGIMNQLHDKSRDDGYQELHKISSELADIVRALTQIADPLISPPHDTDGAHMTSPFVSERPVSFHPAPSAVTQAMVPNDRPEQKGGAETTAARLRKIIRSRRMRDQFFEADLFADPAWDILLDLMAARLENVKVSVSSLCIAAAVPPTTALRWITMMTKSGILERHQDPHDARRVFLALSDETAQNLTLYFGKAYEE